MGDRVIINDKLMTEYIDIVSKKLDEFYNILNFLENEKGKIVWESINYDLLNEKYKKMIQNYLKYIDNMFEMLDFLNQSINRYDEVLHEIKGKFNKYDDILIEEGEVNEQY